MYRQLWKSQSKYLTQCAKHKAVKNLETGIHSMNNTQSQKQMGSKIAQSAAVRLESPFEGGVLMKTLSVDYCNKPI